jgi:hypothetical protein
VHLECDVFLGDARDLDLKVQKYVLLIDIGADFRYYSNSVFGQS